MPKIPKAADEREAIEAALLNNAFMRNLQRDQVQQVFIISRFRFPLFSPNKIIDAMEKKTYKKDIDIIREGMDGTHMYILQQGSVNVTKVQLPPLLVQKQTIF